MDSPLVDTTGRFPLWLSRQAGIPWQSCKEILLLFFLSRTLVVLVNGAVFVSANLNPSTPGLHLRDGIAFSDVPAQMWQRWDSNHYIAIASQGYIVTVNGTVNTAYFPLYPLLGHLVSRVIPDVTLALVAVSNIAFFFALLLLYKMARLDFDHETALRAVQYVSVYPFTLFFSGVFTESIFFLLLIAAVYFVRTERWLSGGLAGMFASATRLLGVAVLPALAWEYASQRSWRIRNIDRSVLALFLVPVGLLAFFAYTYVAYGDFLSTFHSTRKGWGGAPSWPWVSFHENIMRVENGIAVLISSLELLCAVIALGVVAASFRQLRTSYAILAAVLVLISFSNVSLQSFCRYLATVFPLYLLMAQAGTKRTVHAAIMIFSVAGAIFFTALFANGRFIG